DGIRDFHVTGVQTCALPILLMCGVAVMYVLAAVVVVLALPRELRPGDGDVRPPLRLGLLRDVVLDPHVRRVSAVTAVGSFLYARSEERRGGKGRGCGRRPEG